MVITLADNSTTTVSINNGKGITSIAKTGTSGLIDTYTITYNDATTTTFSVTNGAKGDTGDAWYVWIRYAGSMPTSDADMGTTPDDWIGIYSGTSSTAPAHYTDYEWYEYKGEKGDTGDAATITTQNVSYQESSSGTVAPSGSWTTTIPSVTPGNFLWTRTQLAFNDGTTVTAYSVSRYGIDGTGSVSTVNNISPDSGGNVALTATNIPMSDNQSIQTHVADAETDISELQTNLSTVKSDLGIVEDTNTATHAISAGQYVIWKGSLYTASSAISIGTTLSSSNLAAVSGGGFNDLLVGNVLLNQVRYMVSSSDAKTFTLTIPNSTVHFLIFSSTSSALHGYGMIATTGSGSVNADSLQLQGITKTTGTGTITFNLGSTARPFNVIDILLRGGGYCTLS